MQSPQPTVSSFSDCTEAQCEAIRHTHGPLLVLAGPGSGKTRVITRRIAYLAAQGCRPDEILAITFTNKAAAEMRERVDAIGSASGAWISTFHAFCARVLRIYGRHLGIKSSFSIYDTADTLAAVKRVMAQLQIDVKLFKPTSVARSISAAKGRLWGPEQVGASRAPDAQTVARIYRKYTELLRAANAADFDDLLLLTVRLLTEAADAGDNLRRRFSQVLIDEYQDTNHAQYLIAKHLAAGHRNICATGDPDQSIYGWRGADIGNILAFEKDYPDAKVVRLEQNYRSVKRILSVADKLISHNLARKDKSLWTANPEGEPVRLLRCEDEHEEADHVAAEIRKLTRDAQAVPRDIAVFYRINAQSRVLESALRAEAIPYAIVAGTEFFQRKEVKDLLAYLRLVVNPVDDVGAERVANVPPRRLGAVSVKRLKAWAEERGRCLLDAMAHAQEAGVKGPAVAGAKRFLGILADLRAMPQSPVAPIVEKLIAATEYEEYLEGSHDDDVERIANVRELANAAVEFNDAEPEGDLQGFLEQAALISDVDRWDEEKGGVTLMTLHAAKGLEFPVVFIVGLEEGLLPLAREEVVHDLEEERRLLFVGITRAKKRVVLSYAESRTRYGQHEFTEPSRFLSELPEEVAEERPAEEIGLLTPAARTTPKQAYRAADRRKFHAGRCRKPRTVKRGETEEIVYDGEAPMDEDAFVEEIPFSPGDQVAHPTYGRGKLVDLSGYGDSAVAIVRFPTVGMKKLMLKYARLRRVGKN